jgi:hypothetical protein
MQWSVSLGLVVMMALSSRPPFVIESMTSPGLAMTFVSASPCTISHQVTYGPASASIGPPRTGTCIVQQIIHEATVV